MPRGVGQCLTAEERDEIKRLYTEEGMSLNQLAATFRVGRETVRKILLREGVSRRGRGGRKPLPCYTGTNGMKWEEVVLQWSEEQRERFWRRVRRGSEDECWPWTGVHNLWGYGVFNVRHKQVRAYRIAWILVNERPVPSGLCVMHTCDNPTCCNPKHLQLGTRTENVVDAVRKGRNAKGEQYPNARLTTADVLRIREIYAAGESLERLATSFGVSLSTVYDIVTGRGWRHVGGPTGTRPREKLTAADVRTIRALAEVGVSLIELAKRFGISPACAYKIVNRQSWKHLS